MRKVSSYKCPICKMEYKTLGGWSEHMHRHHPDEIPKGFTDLQYFYYTITGKKSGSCVQCHKPTDWNEATGKYNRYCNNPKCKEQYCKVAKKRMIDKYGKIHLLNDPEMQRKMLSNRKIAGTYTFSDGSGKVPYVASYEKDFLMTMDTVLGLKATDIMSPSPHNYVYMYEGKPHFYIPDFYIPSLNLEIEIKDDQNGPNANKHPKIAAVDRVKEALKDETMAKNKSVNYFKVMDKSYTDFFKYVLELKECIDDDLKNTIVSAMAIESVNDPENSFEMALEKALEYDDDEEFNGECDYGFEAAFINHKDEYFNINNWKKGKNTNILYVTGHSGSGKSTLGSSIAKKYHAIYIELDRTNGSWKTDEKFNPNGYQGNATKILSEIFKDEDPYYKPEKYIDKLDARRRRIGKLYEYCINHPNDLFVWEGIQIFSYFDFDFLVDKPVIIKNTSMHTSFKRMTVRDREVFNKEQLADMKAAYKGDEHDLETLRKIMRKNAIPSPAMEVTVNSKPTESLHFETPKELHTWMKNNFSYANFTKLLSPEEMAAKKKGSCHDQALFAYTYLKKMGLKPKLLFFIAYKEGEVVGGMTHTLCYYEQNNKVWWFETAWNGAIGLRSYPTENAMRVDIFRRYMNLPDSKKFPELEFKEITPMEPGYNLAQYVDKALEVALTADERTDFGIPSLKKYPMPDPDHVKAAIRMFNHVDEEHEKELANNIIKYIKKYKMTDINVGKDNRFHKYYSPSEDAVITDVASQVPYGGAVIQRPMN